MNLPKLPLLLLPALPTLTHAAEASAASANLFDLLQQGGWAMIPLGLLSLAMFYLIFHCWQQTNRRRYHNPPLQKEVTELLRQREVKKALALVETADTALSRILRVALTRARVDLPDARRLAVEESFSEHAEAEEHAVSQWINYLNVIATVAPMVGLLGTVSGMIGAFQKIGEAGMGRPEELAGNIGEALITTATGLVIGIPAMMAYFIFRNRLNLRMLTIHQEGAELIEVLADAPPPPQSKRPSEVTATVTEGSSRL